MLVFRCVFVVLREPSFKPLQTDIERECVPRPCSPLIVSPEEHKAEVGSG